MALYLIMLVALLNHSSFRGNKVLVSLFAIDLGASPATIGVLYAMYSAIPILLSFYAGRVSDRLGIRIPVMFASLGSALSLLLPFMLPGLPLLFVSATLAGICNIFYVVSVQHGVGALDGGAGRTRNYSLFSTCVGLTALVGPVLTGFSIDGLGHHATFLILAAFPATTMVALLLFRSVLPHPRPQERKSARRGGVRDLLANARLRRVLIATALLEAGTELYYFMMPIYGHAIGLSASQIGIAIGSFALALMSVRVVMPALVGRSSEERVFTLSMMVAAVACLGLPFMTGFAPLLAVCFVIGLGLGSGAPLSMVLSYNRSPEGRAGEAIGLRQTVNKTIEAAMPAVFGFLSTVLGFLPVYCIGAFVLGCSGWLMAREERRTEGGAVNPLRPGDGVTK